MKVLTLVKTHNEIQLAHLYEHLYCRALVNFLREQKLINYIDYFWTAITYHGGIVLLEIQLFGQKAEKIGLQLSGLPITLDDVSIATALAELTAEKRVRIGHAELARQLLGELHAQPWQRLQKTSYIDTNQIRRSQRAVWLSNTKVQTRMLKSTLLYDEQGVRRPELGPLFAVIADVIQDNLNTNVLSSYGYYYVDDDSRSATKNTARFRAWSNYIPHMTDELEKCRAEINRLLEINLIERLAQKLQGVSYEFPPYGPSETRIYEITSILVGAAGWHQIATTAAIREVLQHTELQLTLGRETQRFRLYELL